LLYKLNTKPIPNVTLVCTRTGITTLQSI
jgi:hypothetical protein